MSNALSVQLPSAAAALWLRSAGIVLAVSAKPVHRI